MDFKRGKYDSFKPISASDDPNIHKYTDLIPIQILVTESKIVFRLSDLLNIIRNLPPQNPKKPVLAPGDIELANIKRQKKQGGIRYSTKEMVKCERLAKRLHVEPLMGERSTYTNSKYRIPIGKNNTFF